MREIIVIAHDIRSTHNVGALFRTAECLGVKKLYLTGYTPYPELQRDDPRLPHERMRINKQIDKTALGTVELVNWGHEDDVVPLISQLKQDSWSIVALEQADDSIALPRWDPPKRVALLIGREVEGIDRALLDLCDSIVEIPQYGKKESLNVIQASAIALYQLCITP